MVSRSSLALPVALLATLAPTLAACSDEADPDPAPAVHTAADGAVFNDADAEFAAALVQHHALALTLVDLARTRAVSPEVAAIADAILAAEAPQIETLTDWLGAWDLPVPETIRDHANAHAEERGEVVEVPGGELPGMPDHEDLETLEALDGPEFEQRWLELMVAHHEGAIEIAEEEAGAGTFSPALELAESVAATQRDQLEQLTALLDD